MYVNEYIYIYIYIYIIIYPKMPKGMLYAGKDSNYQIGCSIGEPPADFGKTPYLNWGNPKTFPDQIFRL